MRTWGAVDAPVLVVASEQGEQFTEGKGAWWVHGRTDHFKQLAVLFDFGRGEPLPSGGNCRGDAHPQPDGRAMPDSELALEHVTDGVTVLKHSPPIYFKWIDGSKPFFGADSSTYHSEAVCQGIDRSTRARLRKVPKSLEEFRIEG